MEVLDLIALDRRSVIPQAGVLRVFVVSAVNQAKHEDAKRLKKHKQIVSKNQE